MQTILGSGGAIGKELAKALPQYTEKIRLVSRNPEKVNESDELFPGDLTNSEDVMRAVEGSEVVYLTAGLKYNHKVWQESWPRIMSNVIEACKTHGSKLVFFDNIYLYHPDSVGNLTEESPVEPMTKKGKVREQIVKMLFDAHQEGEIESLVARAADFYGPSIFKVSVLTETMFIPYSKGKTAQALGSVDKKHSFTYTPDAGKATALLGNTPDAYGQSWHLPTDPRPWTMKDFAEKIAGEFEAKPKIQVAGRFMVRVLGLFIPNLREMPEMMYQYENDYVFNSQKFEQKFGIKPTSYEEGIKEIKRIDYP